MNKLLLLTIFCVFAYNSYAQIKEFKTPKSNNGFFDKKVNHSDTVIIKDSEAHILSSKTYGAYQDFKRNYMNCLNERENDIVSIEKSLLDFDHALNTIIKELEKQDKLAESTLQNAENELNVLLKDINTDIRNLNGIQESIQEANNKLTELEKKIKKERIKLFWRRIGELVVAGGLGILVGAAFFGG
jgi:peptidoglycan hydrolase CwlO-like protein